MATLNRKCEICGDDNWLCTDNVDKYYEWCLTCLSRKRETCITHDKQNYINNFECPDCGGLVGNAEENNIKFGIRCNNCGKLTILFEKSPDATNNRARAEEFAARDKYYEDFKNGKICPKCGSYNISIGQRGYSILTGFLGSNQTMNRCGSCGYRWNPGK